MKPKKSLGQNFLKSTLAIKKIIEAGEISLNDTILEIGPGKGILTEKLLSAISVSHKEADREKAGCVVAVEKDRELFEFLKNKFEKEIKEKKLILLNDDILKLNVKKMECSFFSGPRIPGSLPQPDHEKNLIPFFYKIIANIPYNITGAILKKFLGEINQPERMVLMVQNEVAKRIVANNEPESILSISVKAYGKPKIIMKVPARYFSPAPKVDSAIITIKDISRKIFTENSINEEDFWEILHAGFAHKRKKLSSNLKTLLKDGGNASALENKTLVDLIKILENKRAEELTLTDWINLSKKFKRGDINKKI